MLVRSDHNNNIGLVRYLLALLVIFSHSFGLRLGPTGYEPLVALTGGALGFGQVAVYGFFVLSGVLVTQSWDREPKRQAFLLKRARRIVPGFLVAAVVSIAVVFLPSVASPLPSVGDILLIVAVVLVLFQMPPQPGVFADNPVPYYLNGSLWTIGYEVLCYIGLAALGGIKQKWAALALFLVAWSLYAAQIMGWFLLDSPFPGFASCFLFGVLTYRYRIPWHPLLAVGAAFALLFAGPFVGLLFPVAGGYLLLAFAYGSRIPWITADYSYGLYLYAFPIQQLFVLYTDLAPVPLFIAAWVLTMIPAVLSWHLIEQRFLRSRRVVVSTDQSAHADSTAGDRAARP